MIRTRLFCAALLLAAFSFAGAAVFSIYPGAARNEAETQKANFGKPAGMPNSVVYLTRDSFDKVKEYYRNLGREFVPPVNKKAKTDNKVKTAYFIFDKARNPNASSQWIMISEPFVVKTKLKKWFKTVDIFMTNTIIVLNEKASK